MAITVLTKDNFEAEALKSEKPVLIDFWAPWCGPCRMLSPVVDVVAEETTAVKVCKINVDEEGELAVKYGVMSIPTLILLENGEVKDTSVGYISKEELLEFIG